MQTGQDLLDRLITVIDQIYEVTTIGEPLVINSNHLHLKDYLDDKILNDLLFRLENEEEMICLCDIQESSQDSKDTNNYLIQVIDARYLDGWLQDINDRNINSDTHNKKYDQALVDPSFEQPLEIYENNGQIFMTGSLLKGNQFNAFKSVNIQRIKRIILALLFVSKGSDKTIKTTYSKQQLLEAYEKLNLKNFEDDMSKSHNLKKDIGQQTNELFYLISTYLIDVNGDNYSFCSALGRSQLQCLADREKAYLLAEARRQVRRTRIRQV